MSEYTAQIQKIVTNGPYAYVLLKNGVGQKSEHSLASPGAAINAIRDEVAAMLGPESVLRMEIHIVSSA